jgi:hypothetical protein
MIVCSELFAALSKSVKGIAMKKPIFVALFILAMATAAEAQTRGPSGAWVLNKFANGYEEAWANSQGMDTVLALGKGWCKTCPGYAVGLFYFGQQTDSTFQVMTQDARFDGDTLTFSTVFTIPFLGFVSTTNYRFVFHRKGDVASGDYVERVQTPFGISEFYGNALARKDGNFNTRR